MIKETDKAYAAGFFDGEGCISISKNGAVDVRVTNTSKCVLDRLVSIFGGSITDRAQRANKRQYAYSFYGENAVEFLNLIKPYMIEKLPQVETVLEYFELRKEIHVLRVPGAKGGFSNPDR